MNYTLLSKKALISEIKWLKSVAHSDMLEFQTKREQEIRKELDVAHHQLKKLNHAIEQSMAIVVITDKQGQIEYVNPAFTKRSGYTFEEATGHKPGILKSGRHSEDFYKDLWDTILSGKTWKGDFVNKKKSGEEFWESASISPMFDEKGEITHFVAVKEDISERKILEAELINSKEQAEQANKAKSTFLANMSHEIRTPMNAILGYSEILSKLIKDQNQKDHIASIQSSGKTLLKLINNILDLSKIESGKLELSYEATNIEKILHDIMGMFRVKAQEKGLEITTLISDELPFFLHLDELGINQILINLINNAIKFTKKGCIYIEVGARNISDNELDLFLKIKDSGIGIAKKNHKKIFHAFEQIDGQASRGYEGTGLGLAITKQLVLKMNGRIDLNSELGKGSTFTVLLKKVKINGGKEGIDEYHEAIIEASNNKETIDKLEEVLAEINKKAMPVWKEIKKIRIKQQVIQLADMLIEIGEKFQAKPITDYGKILLVANKTFNIEKENKLIQQFPEFIDSLK